MWARHRHSRGFSVIELVIALVISAIVVGFVTSMIVTPVDAYVAQSRRSDLSESAEVALRSISTDVRKSLPNSVRWGSIGNRRILEMIQVAAVVSYRETWPERTAMHFGAPIGNFSILENVTLSGSLQVVIDNRRTSGRTAYGLNNVITPATTTISTASTAAGTDITISPAFRFTDYPLDRSANQRAYVVSGVTRYECDLSAGVLRRYQSLPISSSITTISAPFTTVARDITACTFSAIAGNAENGGIAIVEITTSRAVSGNTTDRLRMVRQIRVENPS